MGGGDLPEYAYYVTSGRCNWEKYDPKTVMFSSVHQSFTDAPAIKPMPIETDPLDPMDAPQQPDTQQPPDQPDHPMPDPRPPTPPNAPAGGFAAEVALRLVEELEEFNNRLLRRAMVSAERSDGKQQGKGGARQIWSGNSEGLERW